ncbi:hypothetical protein AAFF_G00258740 [Aldrovandia affinis]|uniref:Fcf2 pre-rRNA processing C-terminal domain-containing protein n=1 Tax=Aldrovandia affinis TaxID=143900 RepID=A0AAD7STQ5_9TELE|nr:hypothetical protein AAFF_G00258740 [Aldrovandia affinis]
MKPSRTPRMKLTSPSQSLAVLWRQTCRPLLTVLTRSQKKTALSRASSKSRTEDTELSEADSCSSSFSGLQRSTVRRSTRATRGKAVQPIPIHMEEDADASPSPRRRSRASRAKPESACEPQPHDSDGFESGPSKTPSRSTRSRAASKQQSQVILSDSESEATDVYSPLGSPISLRGKGTPCSSRTGSGSSIRVVSVPPITAKELKVLEEQEACESKEEEKFESETAEGALDITCHSAEVIVIEPPGAEEEEMVAVVVDSHVGPVCSLAEEASEPDKTLIAEEEEGGVSGVTVTVEEEVEPQIVQEAALSPSQTVKVTVCGSIETEDQREDKPMDVALHVAPECILIEESQESQEGEMLTSEGDVSTPGTVEEKTDQDQQVHIAEDVEVAPSSAVKVIVSNAAWTEEKDLEEDKVMDIDSTVATVCQNSQGPGFQSDVKYYIDHKQMGEEKEVEGKACSDVENEQEEEFVDEEGDEDDDCTEDAILFKSKSKALIELSSSIDPGLKVKDIGGLYISVDGSKSKGVSNALKKLKEHKIQDELMKRSVIGPGFEKEECVPPYKESKRAMKLKRKEEREKTTGDAWFNMKAPELTEELTNDLKVLKMRAAMDPKRFYKKNDRDGFPKYFQVGTVVDSPVDFYHSRVPKKQRKRTMVEELLADAEFRNYNKKKFKQIMTEKASLAAGKKNRKKKTFGKKQAI